MTLFVEVFYTIVFMIMKIDANQVTAFGLKNAILSLVIGLTDMLVFLSIKNCYELIKENSRKTYMVIVYVVLFVLSCITLLYYNGRNNLCFIYAINFVQVMIILFSFSYLTIILQQVQNREAKAVKRAELSESKIAFLDYSQEIYEEIKEIRHDSKRHYNYLLELANRGETLAIKEYLEELTGQLKATEDLYVCDNLILQVALSNAQRKAKQQGIIFAKTVTVNEFPFTESELNSIVTNILDNAFEAVAKIREGEKRIKFEISEINENGLMIYCENTYNGEEGPTPVFFNNRAWNRDNHGYGTKIVKKIAKEHKGNVLYWYDNKNYYVKLIVGSGKINEDFDM